MIRWSLGFIAAAAAVTVGILIRSFETGDLGDWIWFALFTAWNLSPWFALAVLAWSIRARKAPSMVVLVGVVILAAWAAYTLYETTVAHVDPQSGLMFVLLPALIWISVIVLGLATVIAARLSRNA